MMNQNQMKRNLKKVQKNLVKKLYRLMMNYQI